MKVVEVFCCSGGLSEGFRRAGLPVSMAFDYDADACDSHEANTGLRPIKIDVKDLLRMLVDGVSLGPVDLFIADPPCTPWSRAGKRQGRADDRDMIDATVAVIRAIRPFAWLIANVPGIDDGPNWPIVQEVIGGLTREGYCIDFARLDAADYGTPQHRVRPFWYGHRRGTPCIRWPARTHGSPAETSRETLPGFTGLRPWVTCRAALGHLSAADLGTPVRLRWRGANGAQVASIPDQPARVVGTSNLSDGNVLAHPDDAVRDRRSQRDPGRKARASGLDDVASVVTTRQNGDGNTLVLGVNPHKPSSPSSPSRTVTRNPMGDGSLIGWPWERPATTVTVADRLAPPGHHGKSFLSDNRGHGPNAIKLSEKAADILQGFPDGRCRCERERWANEATRPRAQTDSTSTRATSGLAISSPTTSSGSDTTDPSRRASTSTTRTKTRRTTESATSSCSPTTSTPSSIEATESSMASDSRPARDAGSKPTPSPAGTGQPGTRGGTRPATSATSPSGNGVCESCGERRHRWVFAGDTKKARWGQIGMAMPPPLGEAVARSIAEQLAAKKARIA